jgi:TRAP-type mannitol/chloroaromatic compound transport system permease large subunit
MPSRKDQDEKLSGILKEISSLVTGRHNESYKMQFCRIFNLICLLSFVCLWIIILPIFVGILGIMAQSLDNDEVNFYLRILVICINFFLPFFPSMFAILLFFLYHMSHKCPKICRCEEGK